MFLYNLVSHRGMKFIYSIFNKTADVLMASTFIRPIKVKDKVHPCTGTEAVHRSYGP